MKKIVMAAAVLAGIAFFASDADAQRRRTTKPAFPKPAATPGRTTAATEIRSAKARVSNQIVQVDKFVKVLRPVAAGIETADAEDRAGKSSQKAKDLNAENKRKLVAAIRNLQTGMSTLEADFQTKPALRRYLLKIEGIAGLGRQSEDLAVAGRFTEADKPLIAAVAKLRNTMAAMP